MIQKKVVAGSEDVPEESGDFDCVVCIHGKMTRAPFQKGHTTAESCLGCLHSDICGPMETILGKKRYFCILVNDKTRYCWFHPCMLKSDFAPWFIQINTLFNNHYGMHAKIKSFDLIEAVST